MLNEWHLFLLTQKRIDAGEPEVSFTILSPGLWTMFSQCPARVRDDQGTRYELSAHFSTVLIRFWWVVPSRRAGCVFWRWRK